MDLGGHKHWPTIHDILGIFKIMLIDINTFAKAWQWLKRVEKLAW